MLEVLEVFDTIKHQFSQAEVPLVYEVIPMLERLEHSIVKVRDAYSEPAVIHIAAEAALTMIGKYYALTDDNEVHISNRYWYVADPNPIRSPWHHADSESLKLCVPIRRWIGLTRTWIGI